MNIRELKIRVNRDLVLHKGAPLETIVSEVVDWFVDKEIIFDPHDVILTTPAEKEPLLCGQCSGVSGHGAKSLVPVITNDEDKMFGVACIHRVESLNFWRKLTEEEKKEFDESGERFKVALKEVHGRNETQ